MGVTHRNSQAPDQWNTTVRSRLWPATALVLAILSIGVVISVATDDGDDDGNPAVSREEREQQRALESDVAEQSRPTDKAESDRINGQLSDAVAEISGKYDVTLGVSIRAAGGVVHAGDLQTIPAWSSIKVPIAVAAVQKALQSGGADALTEDVDAAIMNSDNDAALRLWQTLGDSDRESARYVDAVLRQAGDPTQSVADQDRDDYGGFGDDQWSLDNQVIFANRLACLAGTEPVLGAMGRINDDHRRGFGRLPGVLFKGGWGNSDEDGSYLLREFGLAGADGARVPLSAAVIPADGSDETARSAMFDLAGKLEPVIAEAAGDGGAADCQPR
jgi:hypothetical protein